MNNDRLELARCPPSPTGVHHWMIPMLGANPVGCCKHCGEERVFNNTGSRWDYGDKSRAAERMGTVVVPSAKTSTLGRYYRW